MNTRAKVVLGMMLVAGLAFGTYRAAHLPHLQTDLGTYADATITSIEGSKVTVSIDGVEGPLVKDSIDGPVNVGDHIQVELWESQQGQVVLVSGKKVG